MKPKKGQKLELTWVGKGEVPRLEPRILVEEPEYSFGEKDSGNLLIQGDNLLALKALEAKYASQVKCIYIDPPYNTGSAFEHYEDGLEHSQWLNLIRPRLEILWSLLSEQNGVIIISINDEEGHYLKVLCDEVFGRRNFISSLVWNYEGNTDNQAKIINYHEYLLVYSKSGQIADPSVIDPNITDSSKLFKAEIRNTIIKNGPKNPPKTVVIPSGFPASFESGEIESKAVVFPQYSANIVVKNWQTQNVVKAKTGWSSRKILENFIEQGFKSVEDSKGQETSFELTRTGAIEAIKKREQKKGHFISVLRGFGTTNQMRIMLEKMGIAFTYPKPVNLIAYLLEAFSNEGDIILDSFAGSGTTAHAVMQLNKTAQGRRQFLLIEMDKTNAFEVIIPRLQNVIKGHKKASIDAHGGGFRFYRLAPSLLKKDDEGNWVINPQYNAEMLAAAMAKQEGYEFEPDPACFWKQGHLEGKSFIYTTTNYVGFDQARHFEESLGDDETLTLCCQSFERGVETLKKVKIKKIPQTVLGRCEFDRDDYSLNIVNLPDLNDEADPEPGEAAPKITKSKTSNHSDDQISF